MLVKFLHLNIEIPTGEGDERAETYDGVLIVEPIKPGLNNQTVQRATLTRLRSASQMELYRVDESEGFIVHQVGRIIGRKALADKCDRIIKTYKTMKAAIQEVYDSMNALEAAEETKLQAVTPPTSKEDL